MVQAESAESSSTIRGDIIQMMSEPAASSAAVVMGWWHMVVQWLHAVNAHPMQAWGSSKRTAETRADGCLLLHSFPAHNAASVFCLCCVACSHWLVTLHQTTL